MCIRDRAFAGLFDVALVLRTVERDLALTFRCDAAAFNCFPCLLYTSDAADERSSVDLGGRRIIKKKT